VPVRATHSFFGVPAGGGTQRVGTITMEFLANGKSSIIKTNINYHDTATHNHPHITGGIQPAYMNAGAKVGDVLLLWKSKDDDNIWKAELVKQGTKRYNQICSKIPNQGGYITGLFPSEYLESDPELEYQVESKVENNISERDFPPEPRRNYTNTVTKISPPKNKAKGDFAVKQADYKCEIDGNHSTFVGRNGKQFMEKHHLIPMEFYETFTNNIDDINNIISVCPICHKKIHFGRQPDVDPIITNLWNKRKDKLRNANIYIEVADLKEMYFD
jgi:hypothetical protein